MRVLYIFIALVVAGCGPRLFPGPGAQEVNGPGAGAFIATEGIRMTARADAWEGAPADLDERVTPLFVAIVNEGAQPVRIRYANFRLLSDRRVSYAALSPFAEDALPALLARAPHYPPEGFTYAPYFSAHFGGAPIDRSSEFPRADMVRRALPEGVLHPGGRVSGFLYFERPDAEVRRLRLLADFDHLETGKRAVRLAIPFMLSAWRGGLSY